MQKKTKRHVLGYTLIIFILFLIFGGTAYGMTRYRGVKKAIDSTYHDSGVVKQRNGADQLKNKRPISILLMGTDTGALGRNDRGRTDSMMVITLQPNKHKTTITSIPRDTAVNIPGYGRPSKINAAYSMGQTKMAITAVQKLLNIPIDFYILINMGGMEKVIDEVNGVQVTPTMDFEYEGYSFKKDHKTLMDGKKALAYTRMRHEDPNLDYGRQSRQRAVLTALVLKSTSMATLLNQDFVDSLSDQTQTDMTFEDFKNITQKYHLARKEISQTHLQGESTEIDEQDMEVVDQYELQRVTDQIRDNLGLDPAPTGNIEYR
ncbi:LCP family protein [Companilactobacillus heilongjiangensis]|uniref:LytR family transcriptional regulator n=1 Tax=Companilactobacillus heilongjiangensis TaxID=1074467 RepID=A0A0K2LE17_9LACO|nr:LCP family protein [Companilactobacillus heilongjiangensis]ALB29544.1 LytR family transcriptional regulator [Companilactobacillus heilongjiangensis]